MSRSVYGDARAGRLAVNLVGFGRALRRAGLAVDSARIALALEAAQCIDLGRREDLAAALEAVLLSREADRQLFLELFEAYFRNPDMAQRLLAQMLPSAQAKAEPSRRRPRVQEALAPPRPQGPAAGQPNREETLRLDAAMTASELQRLRQADFNALSGQEYRLVERLAREVALPVPRYASRRTRAGRRGTRLHWPGVMHQAARSGGELLHLPRLSRRQQPLPLVVLVDVSGSMERYARLLLAFLHAATRALPRRDVFAFGTGLTDLSPSFRVADTDAMLEQAGRAIQDFAGGTRLGEALATLRQRHARRLVGRRSLVLLISDGLDTGEPAQLAAELAWLRRHCARLLWLNPLLRFDGYAPLARGAQQLHLQADGMLAVHNLSRLEELAGSLAAVMRR